MFDIPRINDITTTYPQPPQYKIIAKQNPGRDYNYPGAFFAKQKAYYVDLRPLPLPLNQADAFKRVDKVAHAQSDWEIISSDAATQTVEATATTRLMRFKDDIVIEVRPGEDENSSTVHMRSKSRLGKSDLGKNASRIKEFFKSLLKP
ncbi:MAG: DUF1499 domain-containing protein [Bdellovibrionales bacterium]|nr:DUF1499 domain-containing protein [Bdellovibrionales bacterium]